MTAAWNKTPGKTGEMPERRLCKGRPRLRQPHPQKRSMGASLRDPVSRSQESRISSRGTRFPLYRYLLMISIPPSSPARGISSPAAPVLPEAPSDPPSDDASPAPAAAPALADVPSSPLS